MAIISTLTRTQSVKGGVPLDSTPSHRRRPIRVLFVHRDAEAINCCLQALEKGQFTVTSDFVLNLALCAEPLQTNSYDVFVVEYPSPSCKRSQVLRLLHETSQKIPIIFLTSGAGSESIVELATLGSFDFVEKEHLSQLPMAVRRALNEKRLRTELEEAGKALRYSQSLYRALADNPAYGICRCDAEGNFLEVNQALLNMLGYEFKEELLAENRASQSVLDLGHGWPPEGSLAESERTEPVEMEWKRKDGTVLKVRVSGRDVFDEHGHFAGCEVIAVDITKQRMLEDHLRHQASSDSLTGLANHRRLFDVLHAEICRTKRTEREFSMVLLDLDGLKEINDRYGHLAGDRALCRLAQIMADCCRSIDTAARQGGDEFALVLPETDAATAALVARRICDLLVKDEEQPAISVSFGVASYPKDADTIGTLLCAADSALYSAKDKHTKVSHAGQGC
jgi:diguanylate cyclase (GGDEF)-like protein/PAS domain S-box-containing protein